MAELADKDALLKVMFQPWKLAQYTLSRFFTKGFAWTTFGKKRVERLQQDPLTGLIDGDIVNLDDTHSTHPYAKLLPFLSWLYDHSTKAYVWATNLVVLQAVLESGLEYPLFYRNWHKPETKGEGLTKLDLAKQMLLMLRESVSCRLWVAWTDGTCVSISSRSLKKTTLTGSPRPSATRLYSVKSSNRLPVGNVTCR
jgi:hypothetical protein